LCDAFQVPKPWSPQLQPFGKSDDDLGELTFEVVLFFCSVCASRTVRGVQADGPRLTSSSGVLRVLARLSFRSVVFLSFVWTKFRMVRSSGRTVRGCLADSPRAPRGRSVFRGSLLVVLLVLTDSARPRPDGPPYLCGQTTVHWRTVRVARADSPPLLAGWSSRACELCFLVRFLSSLLVLPRVLQGIVPRTRG
jgi:hypothetical protein